MQTHGDGVSVPRAESKRRRAGSSTTTRRSSEIERQTLHAIRGTRHELVTTGVRRTRTNINTRTRRFGRRFGSVASDGGVLRVVVFAVDEVVVKDGRVELAGSDGAVLPAQTQHPRGDSIATGLVVVVPIVPVVSVAPRRRGAGEGEESHVDAMDVSKFAPLRDELAAVLARSERIVAVGEEERALGDARAGGVVVEHLARDVVRAEEGVVVPVVGGGGRSGSDLGAEPRVSLGADEVGEILDAPRARDGHALVHVHALADAQAAGGVVQTATLAGVEEEDALLVPRGAHDAAAEHAVRALHRDVQVRARARGGAGDGRGDGRGSGLEHRGARVDEKHDGLAVHLRAREGEGRVRRALMGREGRGSDETGRIWAPLRGRARTSNANSSSSSSSSS